MKAIVSAALGAALLVCLAAPAPAMDKMMMAPANTIVLKAVPPSKESGKAVYHAGNGVMLFSIMVSNEMLGAVQPSHIHAGVCGSNGPIVIPLTNVVGGKSNTTIKMADWNKLKNGKPHYVNIHKSAKELGVIVSCGEMPAMKGGAMM